MKRWAIVKYQQEGIHRWPGAGSVNNQGVLKYPHRHMFHFTLFVEQTHDERDVEYLITQDWLEEAVGRIFEKGYERQDTEFPNDLCMTFSCETMATLVLEMWQQDFGYDRKLKCEVLEDGENGALIESE